VSEAEWSVRVERLEHHTDARGTVFEPVPGSVLARQRNVHAVLTEPGCVRGNHVHRAGPEIMAVRGPALVRFREGSHTRDVAVGDGEVVAFTFPAGVPHAILNTGRAPNLLIAFREVEHDPAAGDTERVEMIDPEEAAAQSAAARSARSAR